MISKKLLVPLEMNTVWAKWGIGTDCTGFFCMYLLTCEFHEVLISYGDHLT